MVRLLRGYGKEIVLISCASLVALLSGFLNPLLAKLVIDHSFLNHNVGSFVVYTMIGAATFIVSGAATGIKGYFESTLKLRLGFVISRRTFSRLASLPLSYFDDKSQGEHLYRINHDVDQVADFLGMKVTAMGVQVLRALAIMTMLCFLQWKLALGALLVGPVLFLLNSRFRRRRMLLWDGLYRDCETVFRRMAEFFLHIKLVKAFAAEIYETRTYLAKRIAFIRTSIKVSRVDLGGEFVNSFLVRVLTGVFTLWAGLQVVRGEASIGTLGALTLYLGQIMEIQLEFTRTFESFLYARTSYRQLLQIWQQFPVEERVSALRCRLPSAQPLGMRVQDVWFGYRSLTPVLSGVCLDIPAGSRVAFAGRSGCGKTTLVLLLLKLHEPWKGALSLGGVPLPEISRRELVSRVAVSFREPFLWNDTLARNIAYGQPGADIEEAARICLVEEFAAALPKGYDTVIGEDACKLSDGQKQRVALARALVKRPSVLVLDEAMASMDAYSEETIMRNIAAQYPHMTVITVSHRLSTVVAAQRVFFFGSRGLVEGEGRELLRSNAEFADLFASQGVLLP